MDDLVFLLKLNQHLMLELESGRSLYSGLSNFKFSRNHVKSWQEFQLWLRWFEASQERSKEPIFSHHMTYDYFIIIKESIFKGTPVLEKMRAYELEIVDCLEFHLQIEVNRLPYILMMPMMLFILPAFLILMIGPILSDVLRSI
jgi:hypothetical protein